MSNPGSHRIVRRYGPYFEGWAQAFGTHQCIEENARGLRWLLAEDQLGLILTSAVRDQLNPSLVNPTETNQQPIGRALSNPWFDAIETSAAEVSDHLAAWSERIAAQEQPLHLYQTYHLIYPAGTRILTLSTRSPLPLIYRELAPLQVADR